MMFIIWVVVGVVGWTLLEYLLHRFVFHAFVLGKPAGIEHATHHARVDWFAPWSSKIRLASLVVTPLGVVFAAIAGLSVALPFLAGLLGGWLAYEGLHRRIHVAAPWGPYGRWIRRHHLFHHFHDPRKNHGVTSPLWDWAFGTWVDSRAVLVPRRQALKLPWLLDHQGHITPTHAATYAIQPTRRDPGPMDRTGSGQDLSCRPQN